MKIQIIKIYKESFCDVWQHKLEWARVAFAPMSLWVGGIMAMWLLYGLAGHTLNLNEIVMGQIKGPKEGGGDTLIIGLANLIYVITSFVATYSLYVSGFRYGVLQERGDQWWTLNLNWRFVKMALYTILIFILSALYIAITGGVIFGIQMLLNNVVASVIIGAVFGLLGLYLLFRIGLTFLFIAIDREKPMKTSWNLLKDDVLRLIGLMVLIIISILLLSIVGYLAVNLLGILLTMISPWLTGVATLFIFLYGTLIWLLNWTVTSKAFSLVYKSFTEGRAF